MLEILKYNRIKRLCKKDKSEFDMSKIDKEIALFADIIYDKNKSKFKTFNEFSSKIGFWGSRLYDVGGHTPCLINLSDSLFEGEKMMLFLSKKTQTIKKAPFAIEKLNKCCNIYGVDYSGFNFTKSLINGYNQIIVNAPQVFIIYIAQLDIYSTALIHLLKKTTNIKFIFFNHASHFPNLGMTFADVILEGMKSCEKITKEKRHLNNSIIVGLQSKKKEDVRYYSKEEILNKRKELGIPENMLLTISGGSSYKYFENGKSEHYEMLKRLLKKCPNLIHLAITEFDEKQKSIVENIFEENEDLKKRLIIHPLTKQFDLLFQCGDLFIDSFPISSAMTQIDLMSMKVPTTVKINRDNIQYSFHEYMPENYPYMYEKVEDMENGIINLLQNKTLREELVENNYQFWINNYEANVVKNKYLSIINKILGETNENN